MRGLNKVMLYGNLTSDPEVIPTKTGGSFTTFSLATNLGWKNKEGEQVTKTDFHKIVVFRKLGEIVGKYLKRGCPVLVSGRLNNRSYVAKDGNKRYVTEVVMDDFHFMQRAKKEETAAVAEAAAAV